MCVCVSVCRGKKFPLPKNDKKDTEMIIFEVLLTTLEALIFFETAGVGMKIVQVVNFRFTVMVYTKS